MSDTIIQVNRSIRRIYPRWAKELLNPKLEILGPVEYNLAEVILWQHKRQRKEGSMKGDKLFSYLNDSNSLRNCLGLHDALAIQQKGVGVFRELFGEKYIFCWKSVVCNSTRERYVPYLRVVEDKVVIKGAWLCHRLRTNCYSAHFPQS